VGFPACLNGGRAGDVSLDAFGEVVAEEAPGRRGTEVLVGLLYGALDASGPAESGIVSGLVPSILLLVMVMGGEPVASPLAERERPSVEVMMTISVGGSFERALHVMLKLLVVQL